MFNQFVRWLVFSSQNPSAPSLTIKGFLVFTLPYVMFALGLAHLNIGSDQVTAIFDALAAVVQALLTVVATLMTLWGLLRKLWAAYKLPNQVPAPIIAADTTSNTFQG